MPGIDKTEHIALAGSVDIKNFTEIVTATPPDVSLKMDGNEFDPESYKSSGGVFSDVEILNSLLDNHIVIYPFNPQQLNGSSYDVVLGNWYWRTDSPGNEDYYEFFKEEDIARYFGKPREAMPNAEWAEQRRRQPFAGIPDDHPVIVLRPGERVLAHSHEFIGIKEPGTSSMHARSTTGRNGIVVCKDAGWGDPGYYGRWTLEVQNDNAESIAVPVGYPIAQLVFHHTGRVAQLYNQPGSYYEEKLLADAIANWRPEMMLPKSKPGQIRSLASLAIQHSFIAEGNEQLAKLTVDSVLGSRRDDGRRHFAAPRD